MVNYKLMITAEMENVATLQPMGGLHDPHFSYYFKLRCENCGEVTEKETCVSLDEQVPIPKSRGVANLVQKCKFCSREGNITMVPIPLRGGNPLTEADCESGNYTALMGFECRGLEPFDFSFMCPQWKVEATSGTIYEDVDLSSGDWAEYDEKGNMPVSISNLKSKFEVVKG
ncbi:uncharacterized protein LOC141653463 [Silene latifolia]|uniref:uncharacterized protein LOC141653463 n=1 Tax=Silene latifolia TaxID=37657 RepID=UPI003D77FE86